MLILVFYCILVLGLNATPSTRDCNSVIVPECPSDVPRDLMFIMDASDSLDQNSFQTKEMDYIQSLFCAFNPLQSNRAALITFAAEITLRIPLGFYTRTEWFDLVEQQRAANLCCTCCTPTATALQLALQTFQASPPSLDTYPIFFVITDGAPWQNKYGPFAWPKLNAAAYIWGTVPQQSLLIKQWNDKARVMMVGIPDKLGVSPRTDYFAGIPDPALVPKGKQSTWQCIKRQTQKKCYRMLNPPFPIVSAPVEKNIFSSSTLDVQGLINLTVTGLCEIIPTNAPTFTFAPTLPTGRPTTGGPTRPPTTGKPSISPTISLPTSSPTFPVPTQHPTLSPIRPELDGLDMYFIIDRSKSMRWVPSLCRSAPGGNPDDPDETACWRLFLQFISEIVTEMADYPFHDSIVGWKDFFGPANVKRGIRVWLYAFACKANQKIPITIAIGEKISNPQDFEAAMAAAANLIPDGGTCPGGAIEKVAALVQGNDLLTRIYKTAILLTDGVFFDQPRPRQAAKGLFHFGVLTYAMAISIPSGNNDFGLTEQEKKQQAADLLHFANGIKEHIFNFGVEGLDVLNTLAEKFVEQLPPAVVAHLPVVQVQPWWCGWTSPERCTELNPAKTATGLYCKWFNDKCYSKDYCPWSQAKCFKDKYCMYAPPCKSKPGVMPADAYNYFEAMGLPGSSE